MRKPDKNEVDSILMEAGLLDEEQLKKARIMQEITGEKIERILLTESMIDYKVVLRQKAKSMGVEFVDLENIIPNPDAVGKISPDVAIKYFVIPFDIKNNFLCLAMKNPDDLFVVDEIKMYAQMEIKPYLAEGRLIAKAIEDCYKVPLKLSEENLKDKNAFVSDTGIKQEMSKGSVMRNNKETCQDIGSIIMTLMEKLTAEPVKISKIKDIHIDTLNKKVIFTLVIEY